MKAHILQLTIILLSVFVVSVALPTPLHTQSQTLQVEYFSTKDGLSNDYIRDIEQDAQGFVWIATNYGLCRYDGKSFQTYLRGTSALPEDQVKTVILTEDSLLFLQHTAQSSVPMSVFDPATEEVTSFSYYITRKLKISVEGWNYPNVLLNESLVLQSPDSDSIVVFNDRFSKAAFLDIMPIEESDNFLLLDENVVFYRFSTKQLLHCYASKCDAIPLKEEPVTTNNFLRLCTDNKDQLWRLDFTDGMLYNFSQQTRQFEQFAVLPTNTHSSFIIATDLDDRVWCITNSHIYLFSETGQFIQQFEPFSENPSATFTASFVDRQNQVWIGTEDGLYKFRLQTKKFTSHLTEYGIDDFRQIEFIPPNTLYVAIGNSFQRKTHKQNEVTIHTLSAFDFIIEDSTVWKSDYERAVQKLNFKTNETKKYTFRDTSPLLQNDYIIKLHSSKATGRLWLSMDGGLGYFDTADSTLKQYIPPHNRFEDFNKNDIYAFQETAEGIWLGGSEGLCLLDENKGSIKKVNTPYNALYIYHIHAEADSVLWLATKGSGIIRWNHVQNTWQQFTTRDGLSHDVTYAIYEDDYGYFWIPSNYGLMRFHKTTYQTTVYTPEDGLPHKEFNYLSNEQAPDGRLFFGTMAGIISFHPKDFLENTTQPLSLTITKLTVWNKNGTTTNQTDAFYAKNAVALLPHQKSFTLAISLLDFRKRNKSHFSYRIKELQSRWLHTSDHSITINGLPYGTFHLQLKGQSLNGQWSEITSIPITVIRPVYLRWWFITLLSLLVIALVISTFALRSIKLKQDKVKLQEAVDLQTEKIREQADKLRKLDSFKSQLFANIAHEIRTPISIILLSLNDVLHENKLAPQTQHKLAAAKRNTRRILHLVEDILNLSKLKAAQIKLHEQTVPLLKTTRQIFTNFQSFAEFNELNYRFEEGESQEEVWIQIDLDKFEKVLGNLLHNAIKFTPAEREVCLHVQQTEDWVTIKVKDEGIGIKEKDLPHIFDHYYQSHHPDSSLSGGTGLGLAIAKEYARLMQGDLTVQSQPGEGSTFTFTFPRKLTNETAEPRTIKKNDRQEFAAMPSTSQKAEILLVEDSPDMQGMISHILQQDYTLHCARDGKKALEYLENHRPPKLIISDVMMPEMDGYTLLEILKSDERWKNIPVIMLTARADQQDKLRALRLGVDSYIFKPFDREELQVQTKNLILNYYQRIHLPAIAMAGMEEEEEDAQWLEKIEKALLELIDRGEESGVTELSKKVFIGERQLLRKLKAATGMTTAEYIKTVKLHRAKHLLETRQTASVRNVALHLGYHNQSHFSRIFKKQFGKLPSDYLKTDGS